MWWGRLEVVILLPCLCDFVSDAAFGKSRLAAEGNTHRGGGCFAVSVKAT